MCFIIDTPKQMAKEDIVCYKVFEKKDGEHYSVVREVIYKIGVVYRVKKFGIVEGGGLVAEGLHSCSTMQAAKTMRLFTWDVVVECIIPKGTEYYYNKKRKEYVSLKIKTLKVIK